MSAIFGVLRFDGGAVSARDLERMGNALAHRGPDGRKFQIDGRLALGHCLMRVNREDFLEIQPLRDREADLMLVADLRLDNREELADLLGVEAAGLSKMPDSALLLLAYKKWGEDCTEHLLGDFAFAVWNGRTRRLLLGRDHMGQRHVYYYYSDDFVAFATEIKSLWALADVPRKLSEAMLGKYLLLDLDHEPNETLFEGIRALPGGSTIIFDDEARFRERRYWMPRAAQRHLGGNEDYYITTYRSVLTEAVNCRIRRLIHPPALYLSAGYDSSAIAGLAGQTLASQGRKLICVSAVLPEDYRGPMSSARPWVELCRRDMPHIDVHYFVRDKETIYTNLAAGLMATDEVPRLLHYALDAMYRQAARAGARLVMDGLLGDATLNPRGSDALPYFLRSGQFGRFASEFRAHLRVTGEPAWRTLRNRAIAPLSPIWLRRFIRAARRGFRPFWSRMPIAPAFAISLVKSGVVDSKTLLKTQISTGKWRARILQSLNRWAGRDRPYATNEAALHGLDITRPFADKRVVELGLAIPENLQVKNGRDRYLACRALADIYPPEFQTRRRSQDMMEPDYGGVLKASEPMLEAEIEIMARNPRLRKYFDFDKMAATLRGPYPGPILKAEPTFAWLALRAAQYMAWFEQANLGSADRDYER